MTIQEVLGLLALLLANGTALAATFTKLNIRVSENAKDILAIRSSISEHKDVNKIDMMELKGSMLRETINTKEDHKRVMEMLTKLGDTIIELKIELVKAIKTHK